MLHFQHWHVALGSHMTLRGTSSHAAVFRARCLCPEAPTGLTLGKPQWYLRNSVLWGHKDTATSRDGLWYAIS